MGNDLSLPAPKWAGWKNPVLRDGFLRRHGFAIHARPTKGPVLWSRQGHLYSEADALAIAERLEAEAKTG